MSNVSFLLVNIVDNLGIIAWSCSPKHLEGIRLLIGILMQQYTFVIKQEYISIDNNWNKIIHI